jgi:signal transduction histidine kinase
VPLFGLCALALAGVMGWLGARVRALEAERRAARDQVALEESVRLALWRMESRLAPLVAQENARAPTTYERADGAGVRAAGHVRAHLEWDTRSPRIPAAVTLDALRQALAAPHARESLLARLPGDWIQAFRLDPSPAPPAPRKAAPAAVQQQRAESPGEQQRLLSEKEFKARASNVAVLSEDLRKLAPPPAAPAEVRVARLEPLWLEGELLLARRVARGPRLVVQACWLDWPALHADLRTAVADLLPQARLEPARTGDDPARRLAALPLTLVPGAPAEAPYDTASAETLPLAAAGTLGALALLATGGLLLGLATLGERRAAFVSAVTHELRTPLTTFRMYADLLAAGMVPPERQGEYLDTLRREAERQGHLVENVLAYSRLERGRYAARRETLLLGELLDGLIDPLAAQAERASLVLVPPGPGDWRGAAVRADRAAVERVLFNLVDNACKYARDAGDRRLHVECRLERRQAVIGVRDHGPGISPREARRLFRPFHKSAREAAQSAPGVGLGLALSRRLARALGGDLRLERGESEGATFALTLPLV